MKDHESIPGLLDGGGRLGSPSLRLFTFLLMQSQQLMLELMLVIDHLLEQRLQTVTQLGLQVAITLKGKHCGLTIDVHMWSTEQPATTQPLDQEKAIEHRLFVEKKLTPAPGLDALDQLKGVILNVPSHGLTFLLKPALSPQKEFAGCLLR
jgi:hypothetical protein